jgi:hypothetical protein
MCFFVDFASKFRAFFWNHFDQAMGYVTKAEAAIPAHYWIELPTSSLPGFDEMFQNSRIELRDTHKAYNSMMLGVMKDKRCESEPTRAECAEDKE